MSLNTLDAPPSEEVFTDLASALAALTPEASSIPTNVPVHQEKPLSVEARPEKSLKDMIAYERARGASCFTLSQLFNLKIEIIDTLVKQPDFVARVLAVQAAENMPLARQVDLAAQAAHETRMRIMMGSSDDKTVAAIAGDYLDRKLGKPVNRSENVNFNFNAEDNEIEERRRRNKERLMALETQRDELMKRAG